MKFIADLHVHSKFSRATAKNLDLENLYIAAQLKGVTVVGTGDFTYPAWFEEITEKLVAAERGLFKLKEQLARQCDAQVPESCRRPVRFMLVTEISNIYKKNGRTRKNHNLVFLPSLKAAEQFNRRLDAIGNIRSDGRPILGLDARDLLEILLEVDERAFLVPAHIWTPWFSLLGSKSGFDSLEECFEDLSGHIFAAETGLSSDPAMNRLVSSLDRLTLISNSDAHSASKLAREANIFHCAPGYSAIRAALEEPRTKQFGGTIEFYPEEGKYHLVLCVDVMEHILEDLEVFRNYFFSMRDGGILLISTPSDQGGSDVHDEYEDSFIEEHVRDGYNITEIEEKLKTAGFSEVSARYSYGWPGKISWRLSMKYPIIMLNSSRLFYILIPFYYLLTFPVSVLLNFMDVRFGQEPMFRFHASRAVYKGMLRFLSTLYGTEYIVQPLPVTHLRSSLSPEGSISLSWRAAPDPLEPCERTNSPQDPNQES